MVAGLGAATNLSDQYPLGLWIGLDVATGVALAAGGFTSAALVYIFNRAHFKAIIRPALLTALLGYTFVAIGLAFDLGRWHAIWHPMLPSMWQGNSVLFEVAICVMLYLNVLYLEFAPVVLERLIGRVRLNSTLDLGLRLSAYALGRLMPALMIAGVVLSCLHQSSLGSLQAAPALLVARAAPAVFDLGDRGRLSHDHRGITALQPRLQPQRQNAYTDPAVTILPLADRPVLHLPDSRHAAARHVGVFI
jgi:Ni/Fe-hydrogenase subunit HybB-like protein